MNGYCSASFGIWCNLQGGGTATGSRPHIGGIDTDSHGFCNACGDGTSENYDINSYSDLHPRTSSSRTGHRAFVRPDASTSNAYFNGTLSLSSSLASGSVTNAPFIGRYSNSYAPDRFPAFWAGQALTGAEISTLHSALNTYLTAKGAA